MHPSLVNGYFRLVRVADIVDISAMPKASKIETDLAKRLRPLIEASGKNPRQVSLEIGDNATLVNDILTGRARNPRSDTLAKIAAAVGSTVSELIGAEVSEAVTERNANAHAQREEYSPSNIRLAPDAPPFPDVLGMPRDVPVFGTAQGGPDGAFELNFLGGPIDWARRPAALRGVRQVFCIYVEGESMSPWRPPGALVYVHKTRPAKSGDHVIIVREQPEPGAPPLAYIKKLLRRTPTKLVVEQYNPGGTLEFELASIKEVLRVLEWEEVLGL